MRVTARHLLGASKASKANKASKASKASLASLQSGDGVEATHGHQVQRPA